MTNVLKGTLVLDASVIIELLYSSPSGNIIKELLVKGTIEVITTETAILETKYILCRKLGAETMKKKVDKLLASGFLKVESLDQISDAAARHKCKRAISLPDCQVLALAEAWKVPAVFSRREEELNREITKEPFGTEICFLEEIRRVILNS